jgi:hypothetical protein
MDLYEGRQMDDVDHMDAEQLRAEVRALRERLLKFTPKTGNELSGWDVRQSKDMVSGFAGLADIAMFSSSPVGSNASIGTPVKSDEVVKLAEVPEILAKSGISKSYQQVYSAVRNGEVPSVKTDNGRRYIRKADLPVVVESFSLLKGAKDGKED